MFYSVKFWHDNQWHTFIDYGPNYRGEADRIASKLGELFSAIEIHTNYPDGSVDVEIVRC